MPKISERRLDTLAEILECDSMCTAVACIGSRFIIAANEFHTGTTENKGHFEAIIAIMNYFKELAIHCSLQPSNFFLGKRERKKRDELLKKIYSRRFLHKDFSRAKAKKEEMAAILPFIKSTALSEGIFRGKKEDFSNNHEMRNKASIAYTEILHIYNDIRKLEDSIIHALKYPDNKYLEITKEQLTAFKNFEQNQILKNEGRKNEQVNSEKKGSIYSTHAEMQLLSYLVEYDIKRSVYLGISKKCCVDCHCMLDAANDILAENNKKLSIKHAQDHDGYFRDKWFFPDKFYENNDQNSLYFLIKRRYEEQIKSFREEHVSIRYYQHRDDSSSEASQDPETQKDHYISFLNNKKNLFDSMMAFDDSLLKHKELTELGLLLQAKGLFNDFFELTKFNKNDQELQDKSKFFIEKVTKSNIVDLETLKVFLKSPYFPEVAHKNDLCKKLRRTLISYLKIKTGDALKIVNVTAINLYRFSTIKPQQHIKFYDYNEQIVNDCTLRANSRKLVIGVG